MLHLDYETTSACDIKLGAYRYACDPSTRILLAAVARDHGTPVVWRFDQPDSEESLEAERLLEGAIHSGELIYCHNVMFEFAVSRYRLLTDMGILPPLIEQMRCTRAMALRAAIPSSLAGAAEFLGLSDKDAKGKALIGIFSDQRKLNTLSNGKERMKSRSPILEDTVPWDWTVTAGGQHITVREAWDQFIDYCRKDVIVEREVHTKLAKYEITGTELEGFLFDLRMNDRGIPINRSALETAQKIIEAEEKCLSDEFFGLTGLRPSQQAKVLAWLRDRGYRAKDLQAATMEEQLKDTNLTPDGRRGLEIRASLSFAATKKVASMLNTACPDDRMRGLLLWHGAQRTGRWTSSGPQVQNAKKPTIKNPDEVYGDLCAGISPEDFSFFYEKPYECVASCVRNFIQPHSGNLLDADYSGIENRLAGLMANQQSMVDAYRDGRDLYRELAAVIFNVPLDKVTKDQRFVGKVASLACIYSVGAKTFHSTCAMWGQPISKALAVKSVKTFREVNSNFPVTWKAYGAAAIKAINSPGQWFEATQYVKFARSLKEPFDRLLLRLPSNRDIVFPFPQVNRTVKFHRDFETGESREWESDEISFYGMGFNRQWGRVTTHAAELYQNSVQGVARDTMVSGCLNAQRQGFDIFALIHDQALGEEGCPEKFVSALCELPDWLPQSFPLAAEGDIAPYYRKDA